MPIYSPHILKYGIFDMTTEHKSSHIASSHYDPAAKTLDVAFHAGPTYRYHDVEPRHAERFQGAKSVGSYLRSNIAGKFRHTVLDKTD
jgi:hypothetical protein